MYTRIYISVNYYGAINLLNPLRVVGFILLIISCVNSDRSNHAYEPVVYRITRIAIWAGNGSIFPHLDVNLLSQHISLTN